MTKLVTSAAAILAVLAVVSAECPNGCSGHGVCGKNDACSCFRNFMGNDCSERICQFGIAHADGFKGDLNAAEFVAAYDSDALDPDALVADAVVAVGSEMYPLGTYESPIAHHEYQECSNKGVCIRETGECECMPGYEGSACQRASCPVSEAGVCSGRGTCETVQDIARRDYGNDYLFWDKQTTMGCVCDAGYFGPDCSKKQCPYAIDPYYGDNGNLEWTASWSFTVSSSAAFPAGSYISLKMYDVHGEDWITQRIALSDDANDVTAAVVKALQEIPNNVGKLNDDDKFTVDAVNAAVDEVSFTILATGVPGRLKEPEIISANTDGRDTVSEPSETTTVSVITLTTGEFVDLAADYCAGGAIDNALAPNDKMKKCLGDANNDGDFTAADLYNWDVGTLENPHLIKVVTGSVVKYDLVYVDAGVVTSLYTTSPAYDSSKVFTSTAHIELINDVAVPVESTIGENTVEFVIMSGFDIAKEDTIFLTCTNADDCLPNPYIVKKVVVDPVDPTVITITLDAHIDVATINGIYKMIAKPTTSYEYVAPCGRRGVCDETSGMCSCFKGFIKSDCSCIDNLLS